MTGPIVLFAYGAFLIFGGLMGARKGSRVSLYAGGGAGVLLLIAWYVTQTNRMAGLTMGLAITVLMVGVTGVRLAKTKKFMPSGMLLVVSLAVLALLVVAVTG